MNFENDLSICIYQTYFLINQITLLTHEDGSAIHKANTCMSQTSQIYATNNSFTPKNEILMFCNEFLRTAVYIFYLLSSSLVILQLAIVASDVQHVKYHIIYCPVGIMVGGCGDTRHGTLLHT